jgi:capsid assembly protease
MMRSRSDPTPSDRFFNKPLALLPARAPSLLDGLNLLDASAQAYANRPYEVIEGVAVIPIQGVLLHGGCYWSDTMSYGAIGACLRLAIIDPEVRAIALHVNSPGGEVAGCFDLAEEIYTLRGVKPIAAIVDEYAYSAAYVLASAAEVITVPRTGGSGSIGVIAMHVDITDALDQSGIKVTTVQYGDRKSDSYPTTPLSDDARARMQGDVDTLGEMFVYMVARNRRLDPGAVRDTQAGCFLGQDGVEAGLVDSVASAQEAFLALARAAAD